MENTYQTTPGQGYRAGQVIFQEGQVGEQFFVVLEGTVGIYVKNQLIETIEEGGFFGEMALIGEEKSTATAIAYTDCRVVSLTLAEIDLLKHYNLPFLRQVLKTMAYCMRIVSSSPPPTSLYNHYDSFINDDIERR